MGYTEYILIICGLIYFFSIAVIPFKIKKYGIEHLKDKPKNFWIREISIYVFAAILLVLCYFLRYDLLPTICLCGCGALGSYLATKELFPSENSSE